MPTRKMAMGVHQRAWLRLAGSVGAVPTFKDLRANYCQDHHWCLLRSIATTQWWHCFSILLLSWQLTGQKTTSIYGWRALNQNTIWVSGCMTRICIRTRGVKSWRLSWQYWSKFMKELITFSGSISLIPTNTKTLIQDLSSTKLSGSLSPHNPIWQANNAIFLLFLPSLF